MHFSDQAHVIFNQWMINRYPTISNSSTNHSLYSIYRHDIVVVRTYIRRLRIDGEVGRGVGLGHFLVVVPHHHVTVHHLCNAYIIPIYRLYYTMLYIERMCYWQGSTEFHCFTSKLNCVAPVTKNRENEQFRRLGTYDCFTSYVQQCHT